MNKKDKRLLHEILKIKDKQKKIEELSKLYKQNENEPEIMYWLIKYIGANPKYRTRAKELMKLLSDIYNPANTNFELGKMEAMDKNYEKAIKYLDEALYYSPNFGGAKLEIAKCYKKIGKEYIAKDYLGDLTRSNNDKAAFYELGVIYDNEKKYEKARECYENVLNINSRDTRTLFKLGLLEEKLGNITLAIYYFERAIKVNPEDPYTLTELSKCEREIGNYEKAKIYIDKAIKIKPESISMLEKGLLYEKLEDYDEAYDTYKQSQKIENNSLINLRLALLLKQSKNFDEAKESLFQVLGTDYEVRALYMLSEIYLKENEIEKAKECCDKIEKSKSKAGLTHRDYKRIVNYIKQQENNQVDSSSVFVKQMLNYNEEEAIRISKYNFSNDTNIKNIIDKVKDKLTDDNYFNTMAAEDFYIIDLDEPIYDQERRENNKVLVITLVNSKNIIAIAPTYTTRVRLNNKNKDKKYNR